MALGNIIDNASKYSRSGTTIDVALEQQGHNVIITVKDHGVGIAPEDMRQLFKKFQRLQSDIAPRVPGSGLGLFWTKKIVELHGGDIRVTSKVGQGSAFEITLPQEPDGA